MPRKTHIIKNLRPVHKVGQGGLDKSKLEGWLDRVQEGNSEIKLNFINSRPSAVRKPKGTCCQGRHDKAQIIQTADSTQQDCKGCYTSDPNQESFLGPAVGKILPGPFIPLHVSYTRSYSRAQSEPASTPHINVTTTNTLWHVCVLGVRP